MTRRSPAHLAAVALMLAAVAFGGSASRPDFEMAICLLAAMAMIVVLWTDRHSLAPPRAAIAVMAAVAATVAVQLVPLPPALWQQVPSGRGAADILALAGQPTGWRPLSVDPDASLFALTALAPPLLMLWLACVLDPGERRAMSLVLLGCIALAALAGLAQTSGGIPNPYGYSHLGVATGPFASRNHLADLLLIGTGLTFAQRIRWTRPAGPRGAPGSGPAGGLAFHGLLILIGAAMFASASRSGMVLYALLVVIGYGVTSPAGIRIRMVAVLLAILGALWGLRSLVPAGSALDMALRRFDMLEDARTSIWTNSITLAQQFWPLGSGAGTFRQTYPMVEPVSDIIPNYINAAHNDYLQLLSETGVTGAACLLLAAVALIRGAWRARHDPLASMAGLTLLMLALHSLVDYPSRVFAVSVPAGFLAGLVLAAGSRSSPPLQPSPSVRRSRAGGNR